jgi:integrase
MARTTKPLTNTEVQNVKPKEKEYSLMDGAGLKLRVKPNGTRTWLFNYTRPYSDKRANLTLGTFPVLTLAEARRMAQEARELLNKDIDPQVHKSEQRQEQLEANELTLGRVIAQWFEIKQKSVTSGHAEDIKRSLNKHIIPEIGKWPLHKVTAPAAIQALQPLANSGKLEAVKRICQRLNEVMVYSVNIGLIHHNPLAGIRHAFENPVAKSNPTLRPEELPELMTALADANIRRVTRYLIRWQLHTMTRPGEAAGARWDEIDREAELWIIPAERMKKRREHIIPLTPEMLAILDAIESISGRSPFIFPSDINHHKHANASTANVALKRMGFSGRMTAHGMRALASTTLNEQGFDSDLIETALAHVDKNSTRAAYNRADYLVRRRKMMEWWSDRIVLAAKGELEEQPSRKALKIVG